MRILLTLLLLCTATTPAFAYLDPGSGSIIAQAAIALFLGAMFQIKFFWRKIKGFFASLRSRTKRP